MQATSTAWKTLWASGGARLETRATIAGTVYTQMSNPVITRALTQQGLGIGNAVSATCQFSILTGDAIPRAAEVRIEQRLTDGETASEWLPAGTFYVSRRTRDAVTGLLALECYDALLKANGEMPAEGVTWPRAMSDVAADLAQLMGVTIDSRTTFKTGAAYVIEKPDAGTTIHDVLCKIAAANGGNWIVTPAGALRLASIVSAAGAESATADVIDVAGVTGEVTVHAAGTVTGVRYQADGSQVVLGDETGIVLEADVGAAIANDLYDGLRGTTYQAFDLNGAIYDPAAELGDWVRGGASGEVRGVLYGETATLGLAFHGDLSAPEADELADEYPYIGGNRKVLTAAKLYAAQQVAALDDALTQQDIFNRLTGNGAAQGLYIINGQLYVNATYIQGGTLRLGGVNNVSGLFELLDADGEVAIRGDNTGIAVGTGEISTNSTGHAVSAQNVTLKGGQVLFYGGNTYLGTLGFTDESIPTLALDSGISGGGLSFTGPQSRRTVDGMARLYRPVLALKSGGGIVLDYHDLQLRPLFDDSTITLGAPLAVGNGGTGATTAADARSNLGLDFAMYNSVTDLGLTSGSATILAAFNAMGTSTVLICPAGEFASAEVPNTFGAVEIVKPSVEARSFIHYYGKGASYLDYRMYLEASDYNGNNGNLPSGIWVKLISADSVYNGLDQTSAGYALDARQGKTLNDAITRIGNGAFNLGSVAHGSSKDLTVTNSTHFMLILTGPSNDMMGLYLVRLGTGTPNVVRITEGSLITMTPGNGKITIANASTGSDLAVNVIPLSRNSSVFSLT